MAKTALVIVDMVRDFTDPEGLVFYPENRQILPRIKKVKAESMIFWWSFCSTAIERTSSTERHSL